MAYSDICDLAFDEGNDLHKKAAVAIVVAARNVTAEDPGTDVRRNWAKWIIAAPERVKKEAHRCMIHLLGYPAVASGGNATADADVQSALNDMVDLLAKGGFR